MFVPREGVMRWDVDNDQFVGRCSSGSVVRVRAQAFNAACRSEMEEEVAQNPDSWERVAQDPAFCEDVFVN